MTPTCRHTTPWRWLAALAAVAACAAIAWCDPSHAWWLPKCPLYSLTGLQCPTCGATRAAHLLMHGHVRQALALNPLLPVLAAMGAIIIYRLWTKRGSERTTDILIYAYAAIYCGWLVIRNLIGI